MPAEFILCCECLLCVMWVGHGALQLPHSYAVCAAVVLCLLMSISMTAITALAPYLLCVQAMAEKGGVTWLVLPPPNVEFIRLFTSSWGTLYQHTLYGKCMQTCHDVLPPATC